MSAEAASLAGATNRVRVLVVDDSAVVRGLIARFLGEDPTIEVVATAAHGALALAGLRRSPADVVVLDIEMPVMDGLTALGEILREFPKVRVIMASALTLRNAELGLKALQLGASDYISKPEGGLANADEFKRDLISKVRALGGRANPQPTAPPPSPPRNSMTQTFVRPPKIRPTVITIGASTGGPPVLLQLFESLRGAAPQPILLTQHMPPSFTALLAEQLTRVSGRACAEARDGEPIRPGQCYVAPGGWHMVVDRDGATPVVRLNQDPPENFCRPAVDPMLRSAARVYGNGVLAAILTGMGADGAKGCEAVAQAGGRFIVQDEATSVVWGMPGAAAATGLAECILPMGEIGPWIRRATAVAA
jgi:two-component system chemotaxis response regulator CheB